MLFDGPLPPSGNCYGNILRYCCGFGAGLSSSTTQFTGFEWPLKATTSFPVAKSHSRPVWSLDTDTMKCEHDEKAQSQTQRWCPCSVRQSGNSAAAPVAIAEPSTAHFPGDGMPCKFGVVPTERFPLELAVFAREPKGAAAGNVAVG